MSIAALLFFVRRLGLTLPLWLVAGWSAAEAAIFFIVADVPISWIAVRRGPKAAALAAVVAAVASVIGGAIVWWWTRNDPGAVIQTYSALPGIDIEMIAKVLDDAVGGTMSPLWGSFSGVPFKIYAMAASMVGDWSFLPLAPLIRLPRFLLVGVGVGLLSNFLSRWMGERARLALLAACWTAFYAWYWTQAAG